MDPDRGRQQASAWSGGGAAWAWLTEGETPALREVVVKDGEVVKLLEPGQVRRVRAIERSVETPEGAADGPEVWMEFKDDPEPERTAAARGLYEGGMVRVNADSYREIKGKIGTLEGFTAATLIVDGKRYIAGLRDLEPVDDSKEPATGSEETGAVPNEQDSQHPGDYSVLQCCPPLVLSAQFSAWQAPRWDSRTHGSQHLASLPAQGRTQFPCRSAERNSYKQEFVSILLVGAASRIRVPSIWPGRTFQAGVGSGYYQCAGNLVVQCLSVIVPQRPCIVQQPEDKKRQSSGKATPGKGILRRPKQNDRYYAPD